MSRPPAKVKLNLNVQDISLGVDQAIPCGLIINELVSNSLKHAFPDQKRGTININVTSSGRAGINLVVKDNGVGLGRNFDLKSSKSLGLHLVNVLVEDQLGGEINIDQSQGTKYEIKFLGVK